ncbi:unnamed protein product [Rotaria sp. Silwood2]|nr:unnamed protein product [Rotaria sp. Silwood2]CAF2575650.1 unnamed protein product [Rotaria sp. Silwood2]CAF2823384.1 unnamed protein product [Rotaria sp. Silwood2]CAF2975689.1 unnamed protein product [Rotaria sp. Silwood2]CAF3908413.1 unnamed protein product [Rotaria sp. Silwood2]
MTMELNYRPCNLAYYTTWWLPSKSSIQTAVLSAHNSTKSDDKSVTIQQNINRDESQSNCCIPIKKRRIKR